MVLAISTKGLVTIVRKIRFSGTIEFKEYIDSLMMSVTTDITMFATIFIIIGVIGIAGRIAWSVWEKKNKPNVKMIGPENTSMDVGM
jgi:hypothetical protein